jgi:hypothetical protein
MLRADARAAAPDAANAQLVNLQLHAQEQARVAWQGQAWPGQPMQWDVARERPQAEGGAQPQDEAAWASNVRLRFELLGEVKARLTLSGQRLQIQIDTGDEAIGALLRAHAGALGDALEAAGTPASTLTIRGAA